ncbi:MAG: hypothetical protein AB8E82_13610 [Aureispira sp.]
MKAFLSFIILMILSSPIYSQYNRDQPFFDRQKKEYNQWLEAKGFSQAFLASAVKVNQENVVLVLQSQYPEDTLQKIWLHFKRAYSTNYQTRIAEALFDEYVFMFDLPDQTAAISITDHLGVEKIRISYDGSVNNHEQFTHTLAGGNVKLSVQQLAKPISKQMKRPLSENEKLHFIRKQLSSFIINYYKDKGTPLWYTARIDTTKAYYNQFTYIITCLNHEIIDDGYFEYIQFKVQLALREDYVDVRYDIKGKYASGWFCPEKRQRLYKSMETHHEEALNNYSEDFEKKIEAFLIGYSNR